ncbi:MAG: hypothetical protein PHU71_04145 [Candidatus Gracilibacteria bacterium]|nr:hypothetical protein [Candidatus Gracilibacteria bacterium]
MENTENKGYILGCQNNSDICHYRCCDQSTTTSYDFCQENAILLYPGEWEKEVKERKKHILISDDDNHTGKLGYCDKENFDQSQCNPLQNFKPLDCHSYPFFPVIADGKLKLAIDSKRCPLSKDIQQLREHYRFILNEWMRVVGNNEKVKTWIGNISLDGYEIIDNF